MEHDDVSPEEAEAVRGACEDWCAEQGVDPASPLGKDVLLMMVTAFRQGVQKREALVAACNRFIEERKSAVQLGAPAIPSR
nr:hypothetical protein REQ54_04059 [Rhizobium sp. Q54]